MNKQRLKIGTKMETSMDKINAAVQDKLEKYIFFFFLLCFPTLNCKMDNVCFVQTT